MYPLSFFYKIIGINVEDSLFTYASIIAAWILGKAFVPVDRSLPKDRLNYFIEQTNIDFILDSHSVESRSPANSKSVSK